MNTNRPLARSLGPLAAFAVASVAHAGSITGKVAVADEREADRTVIYVESVPEAGPFTPPQTPVRISQKGARFTPSLTPVVKGTTVDLSNDDRLTHNVFSKSGPKSFDLGLYSKEDKRLVTFDQPGLVNIFCSIHPRMSGAILVLENPHFTKPGADGTFTLAEVPAGTYKVALFKSGAPTITSTVKVPKVGSVKVVFTPSTAAVSPPRN